MDKVDYRKEWRVRVHRPDTHDGDWLWNLLYSESWTELDGEETRHATMDLTSLPKREGGPETKGKARSEMDAICSAEAAQRWYREQDEHEKLPKMKEVRIG